MNTWVRGAGAGARATYAVLVLCIAAPVSGGELDYKLSLGGGHSDNVSRVPTNEVAEDIATAGLQFAFDENTRKVRADVVGDLAYYEYLDNSFESELLGNVYADGMFTLIPERITWAATDQFGQVLADPFTPATPENRESINYFSTGPDFTLGLGSQMRLQIGARYSLVDYEDSPLDSSSTGAQLALMRVLSERSSVSLNANLHKLKYDEEALNADFDETEAFLKYEVQGARTNLSIDAGYSQLDRDFLDTSEGGALLRFDASRRISASSTLSLLANHEFSTAASAFAGEQGITNGGLDTAPGQQTADPFELDLVTLGWTYNHNVTGLAANTSWSQRSYKYSSALDQKIFTVSAQFRRDMSPTTSFNLSGSFSGASYEPPGVDYDELGAAAAFSWRLTRGLTIDLQYDYRKRSSDVAASEYTENRIWLKIGFGRGDPRSTRVPPTFGVDSVTSPTGN